MSGYSTDLRKRVIALREKGETQARIGELLGMSISTVKRYLVRYTTTGSVEATVQGRMKPLLGIAELTLIESQLEAHDDWTIPKHVEAFAKQSGIQVSGMTMSRAIKRLGWTRKKSQWVRVNAIS
jgi:transposase